MGQMFDVSESYIKPQVPKDSPCFFFFLSFLAVHVRVNLCVRGKVQINVYSFQHHQFKSRPPFHVTAFSMYLCQLSLGLFPVVVLLYSAE